MRVAALAAFERVGYHAFIFKALNIRLYNNYMDAIGSAGSFLRYGDGIVSIPVWCDWE